MTGIRRDIVETKLADKRLQEQESLIEKPTWDEIKKLDPRIQTIIRSAEKALNNSISMARSEGGGHAGINPVPELSRPERCA
ncbi:MAG: hypothetical protein JWQ87_975 [Candidatus Sulfotelmatobacter sp.]|nr:hypothetical protein [Candidatus Sulfotelmatobacter sp.]